MERRYRVLVGLCAVVLGLVVPMARVSAQSDLNYQDMKGLKLAVMRTYSPDAATMMAIAADPTKAKGIFTVSGIVLQFDNSGHAKDAMTTLADQYTKSIANGGTVGKSEQIKVSKIGDETVGYTTTMSEGGISGTIVAVAARKGSYVQAAVVLAVGEDGVAPAESVVKAMVGRDNSGSVSADANGIHSGGIWNKFPESKDLPSGLSPKSDTQLFPSTGS